MAWKSRFQLPFLGDVVAGAHALQTARDLGAGVGQAFDAEAAHVLNVAGHDVVFMRGLLDGEAVCVARNLAGNRALAAPFVIGQQGQGAGLLFHSDGAGAHATIAEDAHLVDHAPLHGELVDGCGEFGQGEVIDLHGACSL